MNQTEIVVYAKDDRGAVRRWGISVQDYVLVIQHGLIDGNWSKSEEIIEEGLASRTREEQILSRLNSRLNKKLDTGYVHSLDDAINNPRVNKLGRKKPMLAQRYDKVGDKIDYQKGAVIQPKLNGHRCIIGKEDGKTYAYSKSGKPITSIWEILEEAEKLPEGAQIDGELYCHGTALQTINSWVKRRQENTKKLVFVCYDAIENGTYFERWNFVESLGFLTDYGTGLIQKCPWSPIFGNNEVDKFMDDFLADKFEGGIIRTNTEEYRDGSWARSLIKVKRFLDSEYLVVDVTSSAEGWGIIHCITEDGKSFTASAPGDHYEKRYVLKQKEKFIGRHVNIRYPEFTESGLPSQPVATYWRERAE